MYAVIRSGGKQYKVSKGDTLRLDPQAGEPGSEVELDDVLAVHDGEQLKLGQPQVADARVSAKIVRHGRGRKIVVYRFKRRKGQQRKQGHRQGYTEVRIEDIRC